MAITTVLLQVSNQPLYNRLIEDALISYTIHNYLNDDDKRCPSLFPMTKSAIWAMDVIQQFSFKDLKGEVKEFVVYDQ